MTEEEKIDDPASSLSSSQQPADPKTTSAETPAPAAHKSGLSLLDRRYLYQNPSTGVVSSTTLTVRQLCRMFSPPIASDNDPDNNGPPRSRFSAETQLLALLDDGQTYDPTGWKPAKDIIILRHAICAAFYYYCTSAASAEKQDSTIAPSPQGPVSCRQLSEIIWKHNSDSIQHKNEYQVYGTSTGNEWKRVSALDDLELALRAFQDAPLATTSTSDDQKNAIALSESSSNQQPAPVEDYDVSVMTFEEDDNDGDNNNDINNKRKAEEEMLNELEAFLSSTDHLGPKTIMTMSNNKSNNNNNDDDDDEGYESDGGTKYVKDFRTGNWIHEALAPPKPNQYTKTTQQPNKKQKRTLLDNNKNNNNVTTKKKKKKAKFAPKNAKCWIYVTGLPPDTNEVEVAKFFSKVGIIDLDPATQRPKVKVYRYKQDTTVTRDDGTTVVQKAGNAKGDASICYARPESVELALQVLDEAPFRDDIISSAASNNNNNSNNNVVRVERAKFEQHGEYQQEFDKAKRVSQTQRKVARLAAKQARDWGDDGVGESNGRLTGGLKGLRIIVLKGMFHPDDFSSPSDDDDENAFWAELEQSIRTKSEEYGNVEKITVFSKNPQGVVVVKYTHPVSASEAVKGWDGQEFAIGGKPGKQQRKVQASFWDGVEDFTVRYEEKEHHEMEQRHDEFGAWLESQTPDELPEEFRLTVEE